jgi:MFS superfamily sulfate permease-like transporter
MTSKKSDMTRTITATIIAGLFAVPYCTWIFCKFGFSPYFIIATDIMLAVCIGITIRQRYTLMNLDFTQGNLVEVAEKLSKVKTHYHEWIKIAIPMLLIWVSWMAYEALTRMEPSPILMGFLSGAGIGIIIGGFIGHRVNQKIVRKSTEILKQIEELQKD